MKVGRVRSETNPGGLATEGVIGVTDTEVFRRDFPGDPASLPPPDCEIHDPPIPGDHCDF